MKDTHTHLMPMSAPVCAHMCVCKFPCCHVSAMCVSLGFSANVVISVCVPVHVCRLLRLCICVNLCSRLVRLLCSRSLSLLKLWFRCP